MIPKDYLDAAKARMGITSDYALAKRHEGPLWFLEGGLGWMLGAINDRHHGDRTPDSPPSETALRASKT